MSVQIEIAEEYCIARLIGEIDHHNAKELRDAIDVLTGFILPPLRSRMEFPPVLPQSSQLPASLPALPPEQVPREAYVCAVPACPESQGDPEEG